MDAAMIALPCTALALGGLTGFLAGAIRHEARASRETFTLDYPSTGIALLQAPDAGFASDDNDRSERPAELAAVAVRNCAQALAELTRFEREGPTDDVFPLDEDVEVMLATALQATVNILLSFQPTEGDREELGQLEAALHKFLTDYGAC